MAKDKVKNKHGYQNRAYVFGAILLAVVVAANMFLVAYLSKINRSISQRTSQSMSTINRMNSEMTEINNNVLSIVAGVGNNTANANAATAHFENIKECMEDFDDIKGSSDNAKRRFEHASKVINAYYDRLSSFREMWNKADSSGQALGSQVFGGDMGALYTQDIYPLQATASEMLKSTIDIVNDDAAKDSKKVKRIFFTVETTMFLIFLLGEAAIFVISRMAKKARIELEEREKSLAEVDAKLKSTRQKASDLAVMNILTGMKNRYALDNDISERLESDRFNIAVFDLDNFRGINDTYGYDFGDEYLIAVADRLKAEFGGVAEIYNITGNEFCFIFNKEISESQAMGIVQNIHAIMSSPYEVLNITVQLTASGAVYHYLPGDCLNVNSLLVKLDTAMRNAKLNGGNMVNTVVDI